MKKDSGFDFATMGPLAVSAVNPRYFTLATGNAADRKAIYLTGSHIWTNFHRKSAVERRAA